MKLVDLVGVHIEATSGAPIVLLREHDAPHRVLPIFVGGPEAAAIAMAASGVLTPRPLTHDLMASLVRSLDAHVDSVEVTEFHDGAFLAAISLRGPGGEHRIDTRPSDAIALAVRLGAPVFVSDEVLELAGAVLHEALSEEAIDEEVAEFRDFLAELDPAAFAVAGDDDLGEPTADDDANVHPDDRAPGGDPEA